MRAMTILLLIAALLMPSASHAASPEENYVAARDASIRTLAASRKRGTPDKAFAAQEARALADLEKQVRRIVGTVQLKGVAGPGKINLEGLTEGDLDFGMLDGLVYASADGKTRIVVSTQNLLKTWLREHGKFHIGGERMPQGMAPALRWAPFYTGALGGGAAFGGFAEIPVGTETGFATAQLVARAQDIGPRHPRELIVSLIRGPRVFIVSTETTAAIAPIAECEAVWPELKQKTDAAYAAYRASDMKDKTILDRLRQAEDEAYAAYRRCFAERAPRDPNYKTIVAQAQAIVDGLPLK